ncbi:hypothetical protein BKA04_002135 [Cryobacterium mesophilum]|uniref:TadE-like protein n=1 Tax=Terrimesophilobacter mesophilus TaxID=433647 RepID=A0A4R8VBB6_9MICO|nr:hypothetical protein [Terrimesophilobacter mesophilus]MBB5633912.1 hypothetical protein [Terrimesophilobacter mesophilus]TFB80581.1 hypothetical protein E3N84_11385 [Terrimesophilobacter mesophilus]
MLPWRRWSAERGSASLEFITIGLILLVPLAYLVLAMAAIQGAAFAVEGAARQAVRVFVQADSESQAAARAERAIRFALADAGLSDLEPRVSVSCSPNPHACLTRLGTVSVAVAVTVPLPLTPPELDLAVPVGVPLQATSTEQISRFWGAG